jgi:hypothetical protein
MSGHLAVRAVFGCAAAAMRSEIRRLEDGDLARPALTEADGRTRTGDPSLRAFTKRRNSATAHERQDMDVAATARAAYQPDRSRRSDSNR